MRSQHFKLRDKLNEATFVILSCALTSVFAARHATAQKSAAVDLPSTAIADETNEGTEVEADQERIIYWSAGHENGDLSEWEAGQGQADYHTAGLHRLTTDVAHGGRYSLMLGIRQARDGNQVAARIFKRWLNRKPLPSAYYSTWMYFPRHYTPDRWWNVFQFKSDASESRTMFSVNVGNRNGTMVFYVWDNANGGLARRAKRRVAIPVRKWIHLEAYIEPSYEKNGRFQLWQDGKQLVSLEGVQTYREPNSRLTWAVSNYTNGIRSTRGAGNATIYFDDCAITSYRVGRQLDR